jgi:hypothetical protein
MDSEEEELVFISSSSGTDSEWEEQLHQLSEEIRRDEALDALWDLFLQNNIDSKLNGLIDARVIDTWLSAKTRMQDINRGSRLKKENSTVLSYEITQNRIDEIREVAKATVNVFRPELKKIKSYIDNVTASIIKYHYKL